MIHDSRKNSSLRPEGVCEQLQCFLLQIDIPEIVIHEAEEPDAVVDLLDADSLTDKCDADIDLLAVKPKPAAAGDIRGSAVERGSAASESHRMALGKE
jgi:hypothetical protein